MLLRALLLLPLLDVADHSHRQHGVEDVAQVVRPVEEEFEEGLAEQERSQVVGRVEPGLQ